MKKQFFYAGIGSRKTPLEICQLFTKIARLLQAENYILRSGGALGADQAFELGAGGKSEIFKPNDAIQDCFDIAKELIPWWAKMDDYAKKLHARNIQQILGRNLDQPVSFVLCWTPMGKAIGGTRTAIVLAQEHKIPVFNFYDPKQAFENFIDFLEIKNEIKNN